MPTGSGKSLVIAALAEQLSGRIAIIAHRKELLEQNASKLSKAFGFYSASLGEDDLESDIIIAGIQSIYNKDFKPFDYILYDETHRLNNSRTGQGWEFISKSPDARLIGFTATPYRLSGGKLSWGKIIYEISYSKLMEEGYLSHLSNKVKAEINLENIKITAGDYSEDELAKYMSEPELIEQAVKVILAYTPFRHSVLIFCVTVVHGKILEKAMQANGLQSFMLDGNTPSEQRNTAITDFKEQRLKYLINCQILIEGFDAPNIDAILCLRPTKSKSLWEQMCGRGTRNDEFKSDCLLLDMAGNLKEHGGMGTPYREKSKKEALKTTGKICPQCEEYCKPLDKSCPDCGYEFPEAETRKADHQSNPELQANAVYSRFVTYKVKAVRYSEHRSIRDARSIRVDYIVPQVKYGVISEWLSAWHKNDWVRAKVGVFFKERGYRLGSDSDSYTPEYLLEHAKQLKIPTSITVDTKEKFPKIMRYIYDEKNGNGDTESSGELPAPIEF